MTEALLDDPVIEAVPKRARRKDARPGELLSAGLALFVERGYTATRVQDVAERAGVSKGTLFLYYPTKEDLFKAVVRDSIVGRLREYENLVRDYVGGTPELMSLGMNLWWNEIGNTQAGGISKLMMAECSNFPELAAFYLEEVVQPGCALIETMIQRGIDRGEFAAVNVRLCAQIAMAPMLHLICWRHSFGQMLCGHGSPLLQTDPSEYIETHLKLLVSGLKPREGAAS